MDVVEQKGIKVPNAVIVSLTDTEKGTEKDKDVIITFLEKYGSVHNFHSIDNPTSEFYENIIVEFDSGTALQALEPLLPYSQPLTDNPDVSFHVQALAAVYTQRVGSNVTQSYLDELKGLAKMSGKDFTEVLRDVMSQIAESIGEGESTEQHTSKLTENPDQSAKPSPLSTPLSVTAIPFHPTTSPIDIESLPNVSAPTLTTPGLSDVRQSATSTVPNRSKTPFTLNPNELNPPEVQKFVVEHIVRSEDKSFHPHSKLKLRVFSGKRPKPHSEVDYETWRSHVDLMMKETVSENEKARNILESLLVPAADVVKHLGPEAPPTAYLQILDSAFATVEDGEELFVRFMNTLQDPEEKPSTYLQRLQVALSNAVRRGGVPVQDIDRHLLRQFCRGCWENSLISDLHLEDKKLKDNSPTFADLLLLIRTEEDRQAAKATRMKQHLGATKPKALLRLQNVSNDNDSQASSDSSSIQELKKQVADLQSQLTSLLNKNKPKAPKKEQSKETTTKKPDCAPTESRPTPPRSKKSKPKPWYCFRCGEDGHIASTCESDANPALVAAKREELKERQKIWEADTAADSLN